MIERIRSLFRHAHPWPGIAWLSIAILLAACTTNASGGNDETAVLPTPQEHPTAADSATTPAPGIMTATMDPEPSPTPFIRPTTTIEFQELPWPEAVEAVVMTAAADLGIPRDDILVVSFEEKVWPSTALGCPAPGHSYAQIVVDGYRVLIDVEGSDFVYHVDVSGLTIVRCEQGDPGER